MSLRRWEEDLIELGRLGRKEPVRIESYKQLDSDKGLFRIEGSKEMKASKDYIIELMNEAGLDVRIDRVGNIFGRRGGSKTNKAAVMSGSHLDSVVNGGMFDGVLGVVSALEAIRTMDEEGFKNERPIEVVCFMGEEGSAFKKTLLGSDVLVGKITTEEALALRNEQGLSLKEVLDRDKLRGDFQIDLDKVEYFIETHIEQGPILYREKVPIGIVENITGMTWVSAVLKGEENHAGTTPMSVRKDPLVAAANVILFANRRANEMVKNFGGSTVATVGKIIVSPGAPNIIPGIVEMEIDIRDGIDANMKKISGEIMSYIKNLEQKYGVNTEIEILFYHPPCPCSKEVIEEIENATAETGLKGKRMNSGAAHDAQNIAEKVKTGVVFVPSVKGISHSPMEWTNMQDVEKGINVLTQTLKNLSKL